MTFEEAIKLINTKYHTSQRATDLVEIKVNKLLDINHYYYIALYNMNNTLILTDIAESSDILYDISEDHWKELCVKHNIEFNDWHLECKFNSLKDLDNFIALLDEVANVE